MANSGDGSHSRSLDRALLNNIVLKSSYSGVESTRLRFCHANPGSAAAHIDDLNALFDNTDMHVICISETWFKRWHTSKRIAIKGYKLLRADRCDGRRGGGVAMYVRSDLKCKVLQKSPDDCAIDYLFAEIKLCGQSVLIGLIYNPPRVPGLPIFGPILEHLYPKYTHSLLLGDLNVDLLIDSARSSALKNMLETVSLDIISREATNYSAQIPTLIDICATCEPDSIDFFTQLSLPEMNTDHDLIYGSYKIAETANLNSPVQAPQYYRSYSRINMEQLQADVNAQNWSAIFDMPDPDDQLQLFNSIILWLFDQNVPLRKFVKRDPVNPWFTHDIERAIIERNIAYRVWRRRKTTADRERYKAQRKHVNYLTRAAKRLFMRHHLDPNLPPKTLWRNLDSVGAKATVDSELIFSPDQLNSYFTSTQNSTTSNRRTTNNDVGSNEFAFSNTFDLEVFNAIHQIKSNAIGLDGVPLKFLKLILPQILGIVTHIFNTILTSSVYPATWKVSKVIPIAKKSEPGNMSDYRPISVLPALSKAIEFIMKRQINSHLANRGLLSNYQSGFREYHSTSTALLKITNDLLMATDKKLVSLLVLLDFSKAFDSVNHHLLCSKLSDQFGFATSAVRLIMSYLSDRSQCVWADGSASNVLSVTSGVVQGSVLGPLLFSMFINDIVAQITSCRVHLYADDVQLYISCEPHRIEHCIHQMNMDLESIHCWSVQNCLAINPEKSQALLINPSLLPSPIVSPILLGTNRIAFVEKTKNLGIIFNQELTWTDHVSKLCRSVFFTLKRLWTFANFTPIQTRHKLVTSLIVPQFLYGDVIFSKASAAIRGRLKVTLNSCARYIYGISRYQHITEHANKILGCSLDTYYSLRICCTMFRLIGSGRPGYLFDELQFGRSTRLFNLIIPSHRTTARSSSFFVQGAILWNGLPPAVRRESSFRRFRNECLSYLRRSAVTGNV
jgi:Reverse transcriptase (RNA-dependent DNA polymerase)